jgi:hypothetical protein
MATAAWRTGGRAHDWCDSPPPRSRDSFDDDRHGEVDRPWGLVTLFPVKEDEFAGCFVEADVDTLAFAEPAVELGFDDVFEEVGDDRDESRSLLGDETARRGASSSPRGSHSS